MRDKILDLIKSGRTDMAKKIVRSLKVKFEVIKECNLAIKENERLLGKVNIKKNVRIRSGKYKTVYSVKCTTFYPDTAMINFKDSYQLLAFCLTFKKRL